MDSQGETVMESACVADNPRPRDLAAFQEAFKGADGDVVEEIVAAGVVAGMTIRYDSRWLVVADVRHSDDGAAVSIYCEPDAAMSAVRWTTSRTTLVYRRVGSVEQGS